MFSTESGEGSQATYLVTWQSVPVVEQGVSDRVGGWDTETRWKGEAMGAWSMGSTGDVDGVEDIAGVVLQH